MLFLMNDVVLRVDATELVPPVNGLQFQSLSFNFIDKLGRELFAEAPLLPRCSSARAERLASLIVNKEPSINGALYVSAGNGCGPHQVQSRYISLGFEVMSWLLARQEEGALNTVLADNQVWRRLAA